MPEYTYQTLGPWEIRLLELLPDSNSSKISVHLERFALRNSKVPRYEALSYCWGSQDEPREIDIVDETGTRGLSVTRNLYEALFHLRDKQIKRTLWIDAICVNQKDLAERADQVKRMAEIYQQAFRVVIWLGPEIEGSTATLSLLHRLGTRIEVDWINFTFKRLRLDELKFLNQDPCLPSSLKQGYGIYRLLGLQWFSRLWIRQEIYLANDAVICCGRYHIPWHDFKTAIYYINVARSILVSPDDMDQFTYRLSRIMRLIEKNPDHDFRQLNHLASRSSCSDPRDRIYALLGMAPELDGMPGFEPDYTKTVSEVYKDFTFKYIDQWQCLDILSACEPPASRNQHQRPAGLPSWVSDWSVQIETEFIGGYCASGMRRSAHSRLGDSTLKVTGILVDKVKSSTVCPSLKSLKWYAFCSEIRRLCPFELGTSSDDKKVEDYATTLICDFAIYRRWLKDSNESPQSLAETVRVVRNILTAEEKEHRDSPGIHESCFADLASSTMFNRSLIVSDSGLTGLGSCGIQEHDLIVVLLGANQPFILRPDQTNGSRFSVISSPFVQGIMYGEALVGPLPARYRFVQTVYGKLQETYYAYLDLETNIPLPEDPRLGDLPAGWRRKEHDRSFAWSRFVNDETGEDAGWADLRLSEDELRRRGIQLEEFILV